MDEYLVIFADSRNMAELPDESVHLVITSPPYWHIKDYGCDGQIGYGQSLHEYLIDLSRVWRECYRVLKRGRRLCINIGDQFARSVVYGRYKVIPLHAEVVAQCETVGFDYMGAIIWQKKTTMNTTGGAVVMGSFPYPPNGIVEMDYEFILLFKKPGESSPVPAEMKEASALSRDEWKEYFSYLRRYVQGKRVLIKSEGETLQDGHPLSAYVYLSNRLFINRKMIEMRLARADTGRPHRFLKRFVECEGGDRAF